MKKLLAIFAHPDDEGAMGGTLAHYARNGTQVTLICTTRGEAGEIRDPALATPENLGAVRTAELEAACQILGIDALHFLGFRDSGMAGTPENDDPRCLVQAKPDAVVKRLVSLMREIKPDVVVTFEPFGWYGHPDHQATGRYASEAFHQAGDAKAFPESGSPWQAQRLYHAVIPVTMFEELSAFAEANDIEVGFADDLPLDLLRATEAQVTHTLDVRDYFEIQQKAMEVHRTQFGEDDLFRRLPEALNRHISSTEHFIQVYPEPSAKLRQDRSPDLFED